jgi:peptide/nickel transport system ATP-binding protein
VSKVARLEETDDIPRGEPLVDIRGLKTYYDDDSFFREPVRAVDGVDLTIRKGETVGLVGESGCGKTTFGRTLLKLETATAGEVMAAGVDVTELSGRDLRQWQRNAQMVFQDPEGSLNDRMTVGEIVREPMDAHGYMTKDERRQRVFELLDRVGLQEDHYYRYPHQFSGGQRQRVGIARALALEPEFIVLDEPVSALDVSVQARIINLLEELQDEFDLTYLFIAHDLSVIRHIADRTAVMYLGRIVERGDTEDVFNDPQHPYSASLLSAIPGSFGPDTSRITLRGSPPSPRYPPSGCPFSTRCPAKIRPEQFDDIGEDVWASIDDFRALVYERTYTEGLSDKLKARLGLGSREADINEAVEDLFDGVDAPEQVMAEIRTAADHAIDGDDETANDHLDAAFGSICSDETPSSYDLDAGRTSRCFRHEDEYEDTAPVLDRRRDG